jgi:hypothetical protein
VREAGPARKKISSAPVFHTAHVVPFSYLGHCMGFPCHTWGQLLLTELTRLPSLQCIGGGLCYAERKRDLPEVVN